MAVAVGTNASWSVVAGQSNELMRQLVANEDPAENVPFFCECPSPGCFRPVWLTISAYDAARSTGALIESSAASTSIPPTRGRS